jgi:hypothetical protein
VVSALLRWNGHDDPNDDGDAPAVGDTVGLVDDDADGIVLEGGGSNVSA